MRLFISSLFAILLLAGPASAQMITKLTPENIGATFSANGIRWVESANSAGSPVLQVEVIDQLQAAETINVFFYGCGASGCEDITLYAWFDTPARLPAQQVDIWNDIFQMNRNWSHAYVDEDGDAVLVMNVNATGGIGLDALQILVNTYLVEVRDFGEYIGLGATE